MASRVSVNINVNDMSRAGLASVRASLRRLDDQIRRTGGTITVDLNQARTRADVRRLRRMIDSLPDNVGIRVNLNDDGTRAGARRIRRAVRDLPDHVIIRTHLVGPTRGDSNRFNRTIRRTLTSPFRTSFSVIGGILSDGIGQGIIGGFRTAGPIGMAIFAAVIAGSLSLIGAALSGLLVLAIGGAMVALAANFALKSDQLKAKWKETTDSMNESMKGVGEPLIPVIDDLMTRMQKLVADFAPHLKTAMEAATPALTDFLGFFDKGLRSFGSRAFEPLMKAFNTFLLAFGPQWDSFMQGLGDAFGNLGRTVSQHSGEIAMALRMVLGLITTAIDIVNFFANAWVQGLRGVYYAFGLVLDGIATIVGASITGAKLIVGSLAAAFQWVPGVGDSLKLAKKAVDEYGNGVEETLRGMAKGAKDWGKEMDRANKRRSLKVDISTFKAKLKQAREDLQRTSNKKAQAKIRADISALQAQLRKAREELANLNGKTATTYVRTVRLGGDSRWSGKEVPAAATGRIIGMASGGAARSNMTLVGEQGPEMVQLPTGSHVRSNSDTRRLMGQGGGQQEVVLRIDAGQDRMSRLLLQVLREAVRNEGGNFDRGVGIRT